MRERPRPWIIYALRMLIWKSSQVTIQWPFRILRARLDLPTTTATSTALKSAIKNWLSKQKKQPSSAVFLPIRRSCWSRLLRPLVGQQPWPEMVLMISWPCVKQTAPSSWRRATPQLGKLPTWSFWTPTLTMSLRFFLKVAGSSTISAGLLRFSSSRPFIPSS